MNGSARTFLLIVALAVSTSQACATRSGEREIRSITRDYSKCVVQEHARQASDAIISNADNGDIIHRYPMLIDSDCLTRTGGNVEMRFGGDLYRYALADALVNAHFAAAGETSFANRLPLAHLPYPDRKKFDEDVSKVKSKRKRADMQDSFDKAMGVSWLSRYGECIVRQEPVKTRLLLLTPPDGPEETSRIDDLRSAFAACLEEGTLKFGRSTIHGTVAINYYRLALATPVAGKTQ